MEFRTILKLPSPPPAGSIFISRGDATLGPYSLGEAGQFVRSGYLKADDWAARDGDNAWTPLSTLLAAEPAAAVSPPEPAAPARVGVQRSFWTGAAALCVVLVPAVWMHRLWGRQTPAPGPRQSLASALPRAPSPPVALPTPPVPDVPHSPVAVQPMTVAPSPEQSTPASTATPDEEPGPLDGIIQTTTPDGSSVGCADVKVSLYALDTLAPYLAEKKARARAELDRLTPEIAAAEVERTARIAAERAALKAFLDAAPADPLRPSLRFEHEQAVIAVKTADDDYRYLLDQRRDAAGADFYFRDLPDPLVTTRTDQAGRFTLALPPGREFVVAARARQDTGGKARPGDWLVKVAPAAGRSVNLSLDNHNATAAGSSASLIQTTD